MEDLYRRWMPDVVLVSGATGTAREPIREVVARTVQELGGLDALMATQGAASPGPANAKGDKAWAEALDINLCGPYYLLAEATPHPAARQGSAVLIASTAGIFAGPVGSGTPRASTASSALPAGSRANLARGVRVNALCPGWVKTKLADDVIAFLAKREGISEDEAYRRSTRHIPMRRISQQRRSPRSAPSCPRATPLWSSAT
jgi:meso-butanediol dehydrogenase/(S,S)-butanediol dehydrogenase/diacetyl reductase